MLDNTTCMRSPSLLPGQTYGPNINFESRSLLAAERRAGEVSLRPTEAQSISYAQLETPTNRSRHNAHATCYSLLFEPWEAHKWRLV
jgi:hypothetical protein